MQSGPSLAQQQQQQQRKRDKTRFAPPPGEGLKAGVMQAFGLVPIDGDGIKPAPKDEFVPDELLADANPREREKEQTERGKEEVRRGDEGAEDYRSHFSSIGTTD
jgi:hypothetical protein